MRGNLQGLDFLQVHQLRIEHVANRNLLFSTPALSNLNSPFFLPFLIPLYHEGEDVLNLPFVSSTLC